MFSKLWVFMELGEFMRLIFGFFVIKVKENLEEITKLTEH